MLEDKVKNAVKSAALLSRGDKVVVGLSGGADSVCLTHVLYTLADELGIEVMTAHLNHHIRGDEAERDAKFAENFSRSLGLIHERGDADIPEIAAKTGASGETAGRNARYEFFGSTLKKYGFNKIATAHNLNDNAETITMNFIRGGALSGLSGIPRRRGNIVRPLLDVSRAEIEEYCSRHGLEYVTDNTNLSDDYTRNKVRHRLIPLLEELNPGFASAVTRNAAVIRRDEEYIAAEAAKEMSRILTGASVETAALNGCHGAIAARIVKRMIENADGRDGVSAEFIEKTLTLARRNKSGSYIELPGGITARIEYGTLTIEKAEDTEEFDYPLPLGADVYIKEAGVTVRAELADRRENDGAQYFSGADTGRLHLRSRRTGDVFYPAGMGGKKKIKDYFSDAKIPVSERKKIPLLTSADDIMYIVGHRRDARFAFKGQGIKITVSKP